jgi:uncharacterized protein (DUF1800 family)
MKRRTFLEQGTLAAIASAALASPSTLSADSHRTRSSRRIASGLMSSGDLTPYVPRPEKPWDARRVAHLLRRAGAGGNWSAITAAMATSPQAVVDALLSVPTVATPPGDWTSQPPFAQITDQARIQYATWMRDTQEWWYALLVTPATMLREKMTLFWHNHFVSEFTTVYVTQYMFAQNALFRQYAFGDFLELTKKVTVDPAMLIYLDGNNNKAGNPNENYARELMELFTLGVGAYADGTPHYTEHDIVELARALTGWQVNGSTSEFRPARFDNGEKTIFGRTADFGLTDGTENVIDHIFSLVDADLGRRRAAVFLCTKLYRAFVASEPDTAIVGAMAQTLENNDWNVGPVLRELLLSEHFFDENVMGALIKSPADYANEAVTTLGLSPAMARTNTNAARPDTHDPITAMGNLAQRLFYPPNVKGWIGGRDWLSSATVPLRIRYAKFWIEPISGSLDYGFDPVAFVKTLSNPDDVNAVVDDAVAMLLPVPISARERDSLKNTILGGGMDYEWNPDASNASTRIRAFLIQLTGLAEYQLM